MGFLLQGDVGAVGRLTRWISPSSFLQRLLSRSEEEGLLSKLLGVCLVTYEAHGGGQRGRLLLMSSLSPRRSEAWLAQTEQ